MLAVPEHLPDTEHRTRWRRGRRLELDGELVCLLGGRRMGNGSKASRNLEHRTSPRTSRSAENAALMPAAAVAGAEDGRKAWRTASNILTFGAAPSRCARTADEAAPTGATASSRRAVLSRALYVVLMRRVDVLEVAILKSSRALRVTRFLGEIF